MTASPSDMMVVLFSRWEAVIIYTALTLMSLRFIARYNGLAKATVLWLLVEAIVSWYVLQNGPGESEWFNAIRMIRAIAGGILIFELVKLAYRQALDGVVFRAVVRGAGWVRQRARRGQDERRA